MSDYALMESNQEQRSDTPPGKSVPMSGSEVKASLEAQRVQALDQMVEETDRTKRQVLRQMVGALEVAIASLPSDQSTSTYGRFKRVREALEAYFQRVGRPQPREQVVDALLAGGMRRTPRDRDAPTVREIEEHSRIVIRKSIAFHLVNPRGIAEKVIKEVNGRIGLYEWPDEMFGQEG